jgi:hypothetical protein
MKTVAEVLAFLRSEQERLTDLGPSYEDDVEYVQFLIDGIEDAQ